MSTAMMYIHGIAQLLDSVIVALKKLQDTLRLPGQSVEVNKSLQVRSFVSLVQICTTNKFEGQRTAGVEYRSGVLRSGVQRLNKLLVASWYLHSEKQHLEVLRRARMETPSGCCCSLRCRT